MRIDNIKILAAILLLISVSAFAQIYRSDENAVFIGDQSIVFESDNNKNITQLTDDNTITYKDYISIKGGAIIFNPKDISIDTCLSDLKSTETEFIKKTKIIITKKSFNNKKINIQSSVSCYKPVFFSHYDYFSCSLATNHGVIAFSDNSTQRVLYSNHNENYILFVYFNKAESLIYTFDILPKENLDCGAIRPPPVS